jgi:hypothetical protein
MYVCIITLIYENCILPCVYVSWSHSLCAVRCSILVGWDVKNRDFNLRFFFYKNLFTLVSLCSLWLSCYFSLHCLLWHLSITVVCSHFDDSFWWLILMTHFDDSFWLMVIRWINCKPVVTRIIKICYVCSNMVN